MSTDPSFRMRLRSVSHVRAIAVLVAIPVLSTLGLQAARAMAGARLWVARYDGSELSVDHASALGVSPDGSRVFVTGYKYKFTGDDYRTVAHDASTGAELWAKRYNGAADDMDQATALGVSPDGSTVFVTGWSRGTTTSIRPTP
jgi:hypothetical protein